MMTIEEVSCLLREHYYLAGIETPNLTMAELEDLRCLQELDDMSLAM